MGFLLLSLPALLSPLSLVGVERCRTRLCSRLLGHLKNKAKDLIARTKPIWSVFLNNQKKGKHGVFAKIQNYVWLFFCLFFLISKSVCFLKKIVKIAYSHDVLIYLLLID